jgi:hypothetical protein
VPPYLRWLICANVSATGLLCMVWFGGCAAGTFRGVYCQAGPAAPLGVLASLLTTITGLAVQPGARRQRVEDAPLPLPPTSLPVAPPTPYVSSGTPSWGKDPYAAVPARGDVASPD